jgi:hypothetical protein
MNPAAVIVILNGAIVASAPPAHLLFGHVMAPLAPIVTRFTDRAALDGDTITVVRGGTTCVLRVGWDVMACRGIISRLPVAPFGRGGVAYVPLADIARAFGGHVTYDARARIASVDVRPLTDLKTPAPFDPSAPQAAPTAVFTPSPPPATPRPLDSGSPQPRRTPIPVTPSRDAETTSPRP